MQNVPDEERLIRAFSTHWVKFVWPVFLFGCLCTGSLALLLMAGFTAHHAMWISHVAFFAGLAILLVSYHWFFYRLLSEYMVDIIITNKRVISMRTSLLFMDDMHVVPTANIFAVEARVHGIIQNVMRYGSIWIDTGGSKTEETADVIPLIPHPHSVSKDITGLLRMK